MGWLNVRYPDPSTHGAWVFCNAGFEAMICDSAPMLVSEPAPYSRRGSMASGGYGRFELDFLGQPLPGRLGLHRHALERTFQSTVDG